MKKEKTRGEELLPGWGVRKKSLFSNDKASKKEKVRIAQQKKVRSACKGKRNRKKKTSRSRGGSIFEQGKA